MTNHRAEIKALLEQQTLAVRMILQGKGKVSNKTGRDEWLARRGDFGRIQ